MATRRTAHGEQIPAVVVVNEDGSIANLSGGGGGSGGSSAIVRVSLVSINGTVTAANTWQQLAPANAGRNFLHIHNPSSTAVLSIGIGAAGAEAFLEVLNPGDSLTFPAGNVSPTNRLAVRSDMAGTPYYATEG